MTLKLRPYSPKDYDMVSEWWRAWGWPVIPPESLPEYGVVVESDGQPVCAAWVYRTDTNICLLEWFISDRRASKAKRKGSVELLIEGGKQLGRALGYTKVFSNVRNQSLIKKLENSGMQRTDTGMTNFMGDV